MKVLGFHSRLTEHVKTVSVFHKSKLLCVTSISFYKEQRLAEWRILGFQVPEDESEGSKHSMFGRLHHL